MLTFLLRREVGRRGHLPLPGRVNAHDRNTRGHEVSGQFICESTKDSDLTGKTSQIYASGQTLASSRP